MRCWKTVSQICLEIGINVPNYMPKFSYFWDKVCFY
jgi:hypothetical protein